MDSPNHQPYKSKLFNFLNRRSLQWRDRLIRSAQYFRVGVEWSFQILIYPVYSMVQAGRVTRQQLKQGFTQKALPTNKNNTVSSIPKVDRPLNRVFQETKHCLSQSKSKQVIQDNNQKTPIMIQGVASEIESHDLVLVAENNTIIDIFSKTQQNHLKKYIRLEIANYWYDIKQNKKDNLVLTRTFSSENDHVLLPIRWFWGVMGWMQTGTLAMSLDFFGESSLVPITPKNTISSLSVHSVTSGEGSDRISSLSSSSFSDKLQQWRKQIKEKSNESLNIENEDPFRIEFLIYAAIDYFFNQVIPHQQLNSIPKQNTLQSSSENIDNSWLSWNDSYNEVFSANIPASSSSSSSFLSQSDPSSYSVKKSFKKRKNIQPKSSVDLQKTNNFQHQSNDSIEKKSLHWVDTQVKSNGYIKHPLVRVLEWLDLAIHWLEKSLNKLTTFLRKRD